jgi:hypothetical protein
MAVRFRIRRSTTYAGTLSAFPAATGELFYLTTNANNYATGAGKKLYVGVGAEGIQAPAFESIGGSYYTGLLDQVAGVLTPSTAMIVDANSRISGLSISSAGTLTLNNTANTFNTTIKAAPTLAASYNLTLPATVGTANQVLSTDGTGVLSWSTMSATNTVIPLNSATAYNIGDGTNSYIGISTTTSANMMILGNTITTQSNIVKPNTATAYNISDGTNSYFKIDTTTATPLTTIGTGSLAITNGTLSTAATTANLFNSVATTVNIGGAATAINIGAATGATTVNNNLLVTGNLTVNGATQVLNATNLSVQDAVIDFGRVNNAAPTATTTLDLGQKYNYFATTAKTSSMFWQISSGRFVLANNVTESTGVLSVAIPTTTTTDYSGLVLGSIFVNDQACLVLGTAESVISYKTLNSVTARFLDNVVLDGGIV